MGDQKAMNQILLTVLGRLGNKDWTCHALSMCSLKIIQSPNGNFILVMPLDNIISANIVHSH